MLTYPLLLEPLVKPRVWGGQSLRRLGKTVDPSEPVGESWEVADLPAVVPDGRSTVLNGPHAGHTLRTLIEADPGAILGGARPAADGGFPLLVRYLDARCTLPVRVQPPATSGHPTPGEAWFIVEADPGAVIYKGLVPGTTPETLAERIRTGELHDRLVAVPVEAGECHEVPGGTPHALGAGLVVASVRTGGDTCELVDPGGTVRTLHIEQMLTCIDFDAPRSEGAPLPHPIQVGRFLTTSLVDAEWSAIERVEVADGSEGEDATVITNGLPIIWMLIRGSARLLGGGIEVALTVGSTALVPATLDGARLELAAGTSLLRVTPASPLRGMIAKGVTGA